MDEFVKLVYEMRKAQKEYFRTRSKEVLQQSKQLERRVDTLLAEYDNPQKDLFDNGTDNLQ